MPKQSAAHWVSIQKFVQKTTLFAIALLAITMVVLSIGAAVGLLPWLEITASVNGGEIANAGLIAQLGFTFFCLKIGRAHV